MSLDITLTVGKREVFEANITHNLNTMAKKAGLYFAMWRPEELDAFKAQDIVAPLEVGVALLRSDPAYFKVFNPSNGWGTYENLLSVAEDYLAACKRYPKAKIRADR